MAIDKLITTAKAAGYAMVGTDELTVEPEIRQSPDVPAPYTPETASRARSLSASTALVPMKPMAVPTAGWSFFWKATA